MTGNGYQDHGSPVRRARQAARDRLPCPGCGSQGEPEVRRPRHFSEGWHQDPSSYYACPGCGLELVRLAGPAADRPSEVAIDRIPDPEGTIRSMLTQDPARVRQLARAGVLPEPLPVEAVLGRALAGIDVRSAVRVRLPSGLARPARWVELPIVLARHGLPWVVWRVREVEEIVAPEPVTGFPELAASLAVPSIEAAFVVAIDRGDRWQLSQVRPLRGSATDAPPHRSSRRCSARPD